MKNTIKLNPETTQPFTIADASIKRYGSVAYVCDPSSSETSFVTKFTVVPLKKITLFCLEVLKALTAEWLMNYLNWILKIVNVNIFCLCDSQIILYWIKGSASNWKPFVTKCINEIEELVSPVQWKFCKGKENPVLSFGCSVS